MSTLIVYIPDISSHQFTGIYSCLVSDEKGNYLETKFSVTHNGIVDKKVSNDSYKLLKEFYIPIRISDPDKLRSLIDSALDELIKSIKDKVEVKIISNYTIKYKDIVTTNKLYPIIDILNRKFTILINLAKSIDIDTYSLIKPNYSIDYTESNKYFPAFKLISSISDDIEGYLLIKIKENSMIGKSNNEVSYTYIYNYCHKIVDHLTDKFKSKNKFSIPYIFNIQHLYLKSTTSDYESLGDNLFKVDKFTLSTLSGKNIIGSVYPPLLANKALDIKRKLRNVINHYKNKSILNFIDITDVFLSGGKIKTEIKNDSYNIKYKYQDVTIPVKLGIDIISRNNISKLSSEIETIYLFTNETNVYIEYGTMVVLKNGIIYVTENIYANKVFKRLKP